jgi:hypothetical protein
MSTFIKREAVAAAYLRAAHAYMLISIPTETSTIFGVFQAIWLSLLNRTDFALRAKLVRNANFASEIFRPTRVYFCGAMQNTFTFGHGTAPKIM